MKTVFMIMLVLMAHSIGLCQGNSGPSRLIPSTVNWNAFPRNFAPYPQTCQVDVVGAGPDLAVECVGTGTCTVGSLYNRVFVASSAAVEEFCTYSTGVMHLYSKGGFRGRVGTGLQSSATIVFTQVNKLRRTQYLTYHDSYDDCNISMRVDNARQVKECPQLF